MVDIMAAACIVIVSLSLSLGSYTRECQRTLCTAPHLFA